MSIRQSLNRFRLVGSLACLGLAIMSVGCGKEEPAPITAASGQYQVADDDDGGTTGSNTVADTNSTDRSAENPAATDAVPQDPITASISDQTPLGTPIIAASEYKVPDTEEELVEFVDKMRSRQPVGQTRDELQADFQSIHQARLKAAEKLIGLADDEETLKSAVNVKLDALRILSMTEMPNGQQQLQAYSSELLNHKNENIAFLGRLMLFGMQLDQLAQGGIEDTQPLMDELKSMLAARPNDAGLFTVARQAAVYFQQTGRRDQAMQAYQWVADTFGDHEDPQIAAAVKDIVEQRRVLAVDFESKLRAMMTDEPNSATAVMEALNTLFADDTELSPNMVRFVSQTAQLMEMTGRYDRAREVLDLLSTKLDSIKNEELAAEAEATIANGRKRLGLIGKPFVVEGVYADGSPLDWSQYQGKVVLIDFWATWCGPCLAEIPNIQKNYEQYRDKGFEVIGVNLDDDVKDVENFLNYQPLQWKTVISKDPAKRGFENPMAEKCGIEAIPFILLLDKNGVVDSMHVRGPKLGEKLAELLGPPAASPDASPAKTPTAKPAAKETSLRSSDHDTFFVSVNEDAIECNDDEPEAAIPNADVNPYLPAADLSATELVDFIFDMQDKPKSVQGRPGFAEAIVVAADRILAAETKDKHREIAAIAKFDTLHQKACLGDEAADKQLADFVKAMAGSNNEKIAKEVAFFQLERRAIEGDQLKEDEIGGLLDALKEYLAEQKLTEKHLRLASNTVRVINRLEDGDRREELFQQFGGYFAKSADKQLAAYGKKLGKKDAATGSDLVGQPLELTGVTTLGAEFDWSSYRGKVVLVDFWATWCGPCLREFPHVKALYEKLKDQGFEVVAVSLDRDLEALAKYLQEKEVPWTNLAGEETAALAKKYGVRGIPTMMLVNKEGKIEAVAHKVADVAEKAEKLLSSAGEN